MPKRPGEYLTEDELAALIRSASDSTTTGIRTRAIVATLYGAALRVGELVKLRPAQVRIADCQIRDVIGKRGPGETDPPLRTVPIHGPMCPLISHWLDRRRQIGLTGRQPLFCSVHADTLGNPLSPRYIQAMIARLGERAGIEHRVHPHALRHTMAIQNEEAGTPLGVTSGILGHRSRATTEIYLRKFSARELGEHMARLPHLVGIDLAPTKPGRPPTPLARHEDADR